MPSFKNNDQWEVSDEDKKASPGIFEWMRARRVPGSGGSGKPHATRSMYGDVGDSPEETPTPLPETPPDTQAKKPRLWDRVKDSLSELQPSEMPDQSFDPLVALPGQVNLAPDILGPAMAGESYDEFYKPRGRLYGRR